MTNELDDKDKNLVEKNDQSTDIVNVDELDSYDVPIGKRLALGIAKRLTNRKCQVFGSCSTPFKSVRNKASVGPTKRWSKVVTLDIISTSRKQASGKKIPVNIPEVPLNNISFHFMENVEEWKFVYQRILALERELGENTFEFFGKCYEMLVKEFIMNISKKCDNKRSKEFRKVYVRGRCVDFSPEVINRFLGRNEEEQAEIEVSENVICREITTKKMKEWPRKGKLSASALSVKYVVLHRIGSANWVPTNHTSNIATRLGNFIYIVGTKSNFDFGSYFFDQTIKHDASYAVKMPIAFPSLVYGVIMSQHPSILINSNSTCKRDPPLSLHYKLFTGKHVPNIVMTFGQTPTRPTNRICILAKLKDSCKTLDETIKTCTERKSKIKMLIKALSEEEGDLESDGTDEEEENKVGYDASDDEDATSSDED
ncbi:uncharacterized protein LOC127136430 [Lathyrus oleraceus]|uniref:uncharacterized protein LOC127136430 n=1 Tax=Pisum sativum TaxID=3888 RepID=UPI0021D259DC|nr:uncharacterized protein LOC127136430 [Pisum sativum]